MKNLFFLLAILLVLAGCHKKTQEEKKDKEMTAMLHEMTYNEYRDVEYIQFGYLIDRIKASERMGKVVQFGNEEFDVYHFNDSTDAYPYRLDGESYDLYIDPTSVFENHFTVMKTWDETQEKFHPQSNAWTVTRDFITGIMNDWFDCPVAVIFAFLIGFALAWIFARAKYSPKI